MANSHRLDLRSRRRRRGMPTGCLNQLLLVLGVAMLSFLTGALVLIRYAPVKPDVIPDNLKKAILKHAPPSKRTNPGDNDTMVTPVPATPSAFGTTGPAGSVSAPPSPEKKAAEPQQETVHVTSSGSGHASSSSHWATHDARKTRSRPRAAKAKASASVRREHRRSTGPRYEEAERERQAAKTRRQPVISKRPKHETVRRPSTPPRTSPQKTGGNHIPSRVQRGEAIDN